MAKINLTPEQQLAVERRSALLVSAAAGSGKTRVLTQRLVAYITDEADPRSIDEFLVITYTRAAAAELRARILDELSRLSGENPQNKRLRRQYSLCYNAKIGTIHSFCAGVLRENCYKLGLSPEFSVGDEDKCRELRGRALEKTLETAYAGIGGNPGFEELASSVGNGLDDSRLAQTVLELHGKMLSNPFPEKWVREHINAPEYSDISKSPWGRELLENAKKTTDFWLSKLEDIWSRICADKEENAPLIKAYGDSLDITMKNLRLLSAALDLGWEQAISHLPVEFPDLNRLTNYKHPYRKECFTAIRNACKKACDDLRKVFNAPPEKFMSDEKKTRSAMKALLELTLEFDKTYSQLKRRRGILDFSDLEHFAVKLLWDLDADAPSSIARDLSARYREILIDEYQDVNAVQELILRSISKNETNIFMVGDVKQSIYRFRLAEPGIFLRKLESFPRAENAPPDGNAVVLLKNNFRSDRAVLSACNTVFSALMSKTLGDIDYNEDCALYPPDTAPPARGKAQIILIGAPGKDGEESPDKIRIEADYVAQQIKNMVKCGETVCEGDKIRPLRYSDIAILMRSPKSADNIFMSALAKAGIPVSEGQGESFFEAPEIVIMTAVLTAIDNPRRDVPLAAVLASPVFGFSPDDLALIRAKNPKTDLFSALCAVSEENEKCHSFLAALNSFRDLSTILSVHELIGHIYREHDLPALFTAAGSPEAASRLMLFRDLAAESGDGNWRSVGGFLARLESMKERGQEPRIPDSNTRDAVRIMSIHKSKGLEFPVVFVSNTAHRFNKTDLYSPVLIHSELGLGSKITDNNRGIEYPGAAYRAIRSRLDAEMLSEEMRVLYVAMTRAKEKLFVTCAVPKPEAFLAKLSGADNLPPDPNKWYCADSLPDAERRPHPERLRKLQSPAHWLVCAALSDCGRNFPLKIAAPAEEGGNIVQTEEISVSSVFSTEEYEKARDCLSFQYPHENAAKLPAKLTATMIPGEEPDEEAVSLCIAKRSFPLPELLDSERSLTAAEKGTAAHTVMQYIDFTKVSSLDEIEGEIWRLLDSGILTAPEAAAIDRSLILRFFRTNTGRRILAADKVYREFRFSLLVPAETFYPGGGDEMLLLQGIIDCCIEEKGVLTVIDYKTDQVTEETLEERARHYATQLSAYAYAMERITQKPVGGRLLVFLRAGLEFEL